MEYKEFVNNLFNEISAKHAYICKEQSEANDMYNFSLNSKANYDFEHERDRGHTWDIGENEPKLPNMLECQEYASKILKPYLSLIKEAFERKLDIKDISSLFCYFEDFHNTPEKIRIALDSEKNGVINISYKENPSSYDFFGDVPVFANEFLYKGNKYLYDVNTNEVYLKIHCSLSTVKEHIVKLGENVEDAYKFISEYPEKELNKVINNTYLDEFITYKKRELQFLQDEDFDDSEDKDVGEIHIFNKKELDIIRKGFEFDPDELYLKYNILFSAKEHPEWGYNYNVAFVELNAFVERRKLYKMNFMVPYDSEGKLAYKLLNVIDGSLAVLDNDCDGYAVIECLYNSLSDVSYNDLRENKIYYLDSYSIVESNKDKIECCAETFGAVKKGRELCEVTEKNSKVM